MKQVVAMWKDEKNNLGVIEVKDHIFGSSFHPVAFNSGQPYEYEIINNLWYTTYHGARQFFRSKTNTYKGNGRMRKIGQEKEQEIC
ncbi:hypothetical protein [Halobacillus litoralis]|uniref:hypothetical protein n=1 Tax=Halobacillus litoralis TaxID=45668 RepID=UPI001CFDC3F7|nr:hypothetical protein [Halobacillus litoralis]